ncbi:DUF169 domain-containing protein [bacterium]|nr:DUF169 domain-containing protein [bacterium]
MSTLLDATYLLDRLQINIPLIGVYDAPQDADFGSVIEPSPYKNTCLFAYFNAWKRGRTLKLTSTNYGCAANGYWFFGKEKSSKEELVNYWLNEEGWKCSKPLMEDWLSVYPPYQSKNKCIYIGPIKNSMEKYLKSITFFVTPDQLSALVIGANYFSGSDLESPLSLPSGSGCMKLLNLIPQGDVAKAIIGATDLTMRKFIPKDVLAFTVNPAMFEQLCKLDKNSFLGKTLVKELQQVRMDSK